MIGTKKILWAVAGGLGIAIALSISFFSVKDNQNSYKIAIFQSSSHTSIEEAIKGFESKIRQNDLYSEKKIVYKYFNPELNKAISRSMVQEILSGKYDMVVTFSTPALQMIAEYNNNGKIPHVFGVVNDPYSAEVGISRQGRRHPSNLTGINTPPPVRRTFRLARLCNPKLTKAGTIVNPNDSSSMTCLKKAREICKTLGIKLEVARVFSRHQVESAAYELQRKGVEAVFVGGDNTVDQCVKTISNVFGPNGIPIFAYIPSHTAEGAVLGLGASYFEIGRLMAAIALKIINGKSPAEIPVRDILPLQLAINQKTAQHLNSNWKIPQEIINNASIILKGNDDDDLVSMGFSQSEDETRKTLSDTQTLPQLYFINYNYEYPVEETMNGFLAGMKRQGMTLGKTYELQIVNAGKDIKKLESLFEENNKNPNCDVILLTTTPALIAAVKMVHDKPVVFSTVTDPIAVGAGKSNDNHLKNFTGVSCMCNFKRMVSLIKRCFPKARNIGTLYNPNEKNSKVNYKLFKEELESANLQPVAIPNSSLEHLPTAIDELIQSKVDVICQLNDFLHDAQFSTISTAARTAHIPIIGFLSSHAKNNGAVLVLVTDFEEGGRMQAKLVMQILKGTSPANLPFLQIERSRLIINRKNAEYFNVKIPSNILDEADMVIE